METAGYKVVHFRRIRGYRTLTDFEERDEQLLILAVKGIIVHNLFENLDMVIKIYYYSILDNADLVVSVINIKSKFSRFSN